MKLIKVLMDSPPLSESNHTSKSFLSPQEVIVPRISIGFNGHINCHKECDDYLRHGQNLPMLIVNKLGIKYWTFHFIIIPCVQFHFRASTMYNVCTQRYYTYKKTSARLIRIIEIKSHFYLSAQNQLCTM